MENFIEEVWKFFHEHPENAFQEKETAAFIAGKLRAFGYDVAENLGGTGVVGVLDSGVPGVNLGLRADMDCLVFNVDGKPTNYHGCGHDGNMSMLLAAAKRISEEGIKRGKLFLIFQPAEETLCGSNGLIESGKLDGLDEIVGMHLQPAAEELPGHASPRLMHKAYGNIELTVHGRSAHASMPHLGINATEAGVQIVNAVNCVRCDSRSPYSCKVTVFKADGSSRNTIPDKAELSFDLRADSNEVMEQLIARVKHAALCAADAAGAQVEFTREVFCRAAKYDDELAGVVKGVLAEVLGEDCAHDETSCTCSEDFHNYSGMLGCKAAYVSLGADFTPYLHAYGAAYDHAYLKKGAEVFIRTVHARLG